MGLTDGTNNMVMPVSPMYNNGGFGNGMFGGDYMFWFVILILAMNGGWGNGLGNNAGGMIPYMMNNNTNNDVQRGFDQQSVMNGINTINSNVMNGHSGHSIKDRMIADLERMMDSTQSDYERQQILETIKSIEQRETGR